MHLVQPEHMYASSYCIFITEYNWNLALKGRPFLLNFPLGL